MTWNKMIDLVSGTAAIKCMERKGKSARGGEEGSDLFTSAPAMAGAHTWVVVEGLPLG